MRQFCAVLRSFFHSSLLHTFPATLLHQLFFHPLSSHLPIFSLAYFSILSFPNSYIILLWKFYFLPFSVHAQTNVIYLTLLSLLQWVFNTCINFFIGYKLQFSFSLSYTGPKILLYTFLLKMFNCFLSLFVSVQILVHGSWKHIISTEKDNVMKEMAFCGK